MLQRLQYQHLSPVMQVLLSRLQQSTPQDREWVHSLSALVGHRQRTIQPRLCKNLFRRRLRIRLAASASTTSSMILSLPESVRCRSQRRASGQSNVASRIKFTAGLQRKTQATIPTRNRTEIIRGSRWPRAPQAPRLSRLCKSMMIDDSHTRLVNLWRRIDLLRRSVDRTPCRAGVRRTIDPPVTCRPGLFRHQITLPQARRTTGIACHHCLRRSSGHRLFTTVQAQWKVDCTVLEFRWMTREDQCFRDRRLHDCQPHCLLLRVRIAPRLCRLQDLRPIGALGLPA